MMVHERSSSFRKFSRVLCPRLVFTISQSVPNAAANITGKISLMSDPVVTRLGEGYTEALEKFLQQRGLRLQAIAAGETIPGSYWGESEAGLIGDTLYVRPDTPVHSALHEACHWLCMDPARRANLHTDAKGSDTEEHAVCYLQCLLADQLPGYSRARVFADMDAWGYNFVLGSAQAWFERDAEDALAWLKLQGLMF
jgi:hypothetical protein